MGGPRGGILAQHGTVQGLNNVVFFSHARLSACTLQTASSADFGKCQLMRIAMTRALRLYLAHPRAILQAWFDKFG